MATEKRLIDANALIEEMKDCAITRQDLYCNGYAQTFIENAPTVDAVEVVRCKKCTHCHKFKKWHGVEYLGCIRIPSEVHEVEPAHYCSYGERRTDQ